MVNVRIIAFTGYYVPGYKGGGAIRTIANLVHQLGDEFCFRVVTMDRDLEDVEPYFGIVANSW